MKMSKKIISMAMIATMTFSMVEPAVALDESTEKEEVIYINLSADGSVKDIYAVNIFDGGAVIDYGDYSSVEMLNVNEKISQDGDLITFATDEGRVYYKGKMETSVIPWNISIRYYIDGKEYSPKEVAGKSGKLEIRFSVTQNEKYKGNFYDNYALQATFTLSTKKCSNIETDGATVANVGSNKQIMYTMLPGEGIDTVITADVKSFEMDAVAINGIPLSLNVEIDDEELLSQVTDLIEAIEKLDDGAGELNDGASELRDGADALEDGINDLKNGASDLNEGVEKLNEGIALAKSGLDELNSKSSELTGASSEVYKVLTEIQTELGKVSMSVEQIEQLVQGSSQINNGLKELSAAITQLNNNVSFGVYKSVMYNNGLDIDVIQSGNSSTIDELNNQISSLTQQKEYLENNGGDAGTIATLEANITQLTGIRDLLIGNRAAINGMSAYLSGVSSSISEISAGVSQLKDNYALIDAGINEIANRIEPMMANMSALKNGIDTLVTEYGKLDNGINEYTAGVAKIVAGYTELTAGASELLNGSRDMKTGTATLYDKTGEFVTGIVEFYDGTDELKDGTGELREETSGMDDEISDKIDEMLGSITGDSFETCSFVSDKNKNVKAVQFVIQTESIDIEETVNVTTEAKEELNFWQKLLRLFGLY